MVAVSKPTKQKYFQINSFYPIFFKTLKTNLKAVSFSTNRRFSLFSNCLKFMILSLICFCSGLETPAN